MNPQDWIDARTACAMLGVKPQTLYAYVSRHKIRVAADPADARSSFYSQRDIEHLMHQKRRPRARRDVAQAAIRWGDPVLTTSISEVREGTLWLRGRAIEACAQDMSLEEVAALLCDVTRVRCPPTQDLVTGSTTFGRAMQALAQIADLSSPIDPGQRDQIMADVGRMMSLVADACLGQIHEGPIHSRIGRALGLGDHETDLVRQALVLLSDHELNPSTFAVRVCASTGTSLPAALLAGVATLSGARHGGAGDMTIRAIHAQRSGTFGTFRAAHPGLDPYAFGFGHPLYPDGDPRAAHLLRLLPATDPGVRSVRDVSDHLGRAPNIDAALAALSLYIKRPETAAQTIFAIGRVAGWAAHAIEQVQTGTIIRPRAHFQAARSEQP